MPTYVGSSTVVATNGAAPGAITPFVNTNAIGDIIFWFHYSRAAGGNETVTRPTGFTDIGSWLVAGDGLLSAAWKQRGTADTTYTAAGLTNHTSGTTGETVLEWCETWTDCDLTNPIAGVVSSQSTWASSTTMGPVAATGLPQIQPGGAVIVFAGRFENTTSMTTLSGDGLVWSPATVADSTLGSDASAVTQLGENQTETAVTVTSKSVSTVGTAGTGMGVMIALNPPPSRNISGIFPESSSFIGPFQAGDDLYTVTEFHEPTPRAAIRKSHDGGNTWLEMDQLNRPSQTFDLEVIWLQDVGSGVIRGARARSGTSANHISAFDFHTSAHATTPDTWNTTVDQVVGTLSAGPVDQSTNFVRRSNGDEYVFYQDETAADERVVYKKKPSGGAWGTEQAIDNTASVDFIHISAVLNTSNDVIHLFYRDNTNSNLLHRTLNASDTLSGSQIINDTAIRVGSSHYHSVVTPHLYWDEAGAEKVYVAWVRGSDDRLVGSLLTNGSPAADEVITDVACWLNPPNMLSLEPSATLMRDAATGIIYCPYADATNHDIQLAVRDPATGWGTDTEIVDAVEAQQVRGVVLTHSAANGGSRVLSLLYDDLPAGGDATTQGIPKYTEVLLAAPTVALTSLVMAPRRAR